MANLWVDGFEGYSGTITQAYPLSNATVAAGGRGGGRLAGHDVKLGPLNITTGTEVIVGCAMIGPGDVFQFETAGQFPLVVNVDSLGRIIGTFRPEGGGTNLFTIIPPMLLLGVWRYYECKFTIEDATHLSFEMRVDETTVVPMDTYTTTTMTPLVIAAITINGSDSVCDDFYVNDDTGGSPDDDYWGDTRMLILHPNGAGVASDWDPTPAVANYLNVDDVLTDAAATFNETDTVTDRDTFEYEDTGLPGGTVIRTVAVMTSAARLSDSGPRELTSHIVHGASETTGGIHALSDTYYMEQLRVPLCPSTSAAWTPAQVDAAKGGYELTA